jgi:hypothetical protein
MNIHQYARRSFALGFALCGLAASSAHAYGPGSPASVTSVPAGYTLCGKDYAVCRVPAGATAYVVYGTGTTYATAQGTGDFTCLPKGFVKTPSAGTPQDLGIDDPAPKIGKQCYVKIAGGNVPAVASTPSPTPASQPTASGGGYAPGSPATMTAVPPGFTACGTDGKVCRVAAGAAVYVVYGAGSRYGTAQGTGDFTCLPRGFVKTPSATTPRDLGIDDPAPGIGKTCYVKVAGATSPVASTPSQPSPAPVSKPTASTGGYGPGSPANLSAVPAGFTACGTDGKVCRVAAGATVYVVYGAGTRYGTAQGTGDFTCLPKGFVRAPSASNPQDLGIADPAPGTGKTCYVKATGGAPTVASAPPVSKSPVNTSAPTKASVVGCNAYSGAIYNARAKQYSTIAQLNGNYYKNEGVVASSPANAAATCAMMCGATGEPAPCSWFSVTKWLSTNTANGRDSIAYVCHMFNDRSLKQITTPSLQKEVNLGSPSAPARFQDAQSYACRG